jgi:hypothetical protein
MKISSLALISLRALICKLIPLKTGAAFGWHEWLYERNSSLIWFSEYIINLKVLQNWDFDIKSSSRFVEVFVQYWKRINTHSTKQLKQFFVIEINLT